MTDFELNSEQQISVERLVDWTKNKVQSTASVEGFAGTGKTTMIKYFCDYLIENKLYSKSDIVVSAPTNQATKVIVDKTNYRGHTIQSILGLRPDVSVENFSPTNPIFNPIADLRLDYKILIIDESSMINAKLFSFISETMTRYNKKVIYMGDRYQLPPINEPLSKVFLECDLKLKLTKVVRQGNSNPTSILIETAVNDVINGTNNLLTFINNNKGFSDFNEKEEGFAIFNENLALNNGDELFNHFIKRKENFLNKTAKVIAYTNNYVEDMNISLRKKILNFNDYINVGDVLLGYSNQSDNKINIIINSFHYKVIKVKPSFKVLKGIKFKTFILTVKSESSFSPIIMEIVDRSDLETRTNHTQTVNDLFTEAKKNRRRWKDYYEFTEAMFTKSTIIKDNGYSKIVTKKKDIDFGYCTTTHKSQGSTYDYCFIPYRNLMSCFKAEDRRKLFYVAISRASKANLFY